MSPTSKAPLLLAHEREIAFVSVRTDPTLAAFHYTVLESIRQRWAGGQIPCCDYEFTQRPKTIDVPRVQSSKTSPKPQPDQRLEVPTDHGRARAFGLECLRERVNGRFAMLRLRLQCSSSSTRLSRHFPALGRIGAWKLFIGIRLSLKGELFVVGGRNGALHGSGDLAVLNGQELRIVLRTTGSSFVVSGP